MARTHARGQSRSMLCRVIGWVMLMKGMLSTATSSAQHLRVSANQRFLIREDGRPFFWLGDTAWALFSRLDKPDTEFYLETRAQQGFNVVQCVLLGDDNSLTVPTPEGHVPLMDRDPSRPNPAYFEHVDWVMDRAARYGMYLAMLPVWGAHVQGQGDRQSDSHVAFSETSARAYGRFLGERYKDSWNVVWVLGGDRVPTGFEEIWTAMAAGLEEGDGGNHLKTYHIYGEHSSSEFWHHADWLDFNMLQSGHPLGVFSNNYDYVRQDYEKVPPKPTLDGEALYEDMPIGFVPTNGRATAHHVRANAYWAVFAGALGHTYGHLSVMQMCRPEEGCTFWAEISWREALASEGSGQMKHLKNLMLSRPFLSRIPDQSLLDPLPIPGAAHPQLTRDGTPGQNDATYLMVYYPYVIWTHKIRTSAISSSQLRAWWYSPRTGAAIDLGLADNAGVFDLEWNTRLDEATDGPDWVLVIDGAEWNYPPPGTITS